MENWISKKELSLEGYKYDSPVEEEFYRLLVDYEIGSKVKSIYIQKTIPTYKNYRRVDFILEVVPNRKIFIEIEGSHHDTLEFQEKDRDRYQELRHAEPNAWFLYYSARDVYKYPKCVITSIDNAIEELRTLEYGEPTS